MAAQMDTELTKSKLPKRAGAQTASTHSAAPAKAAAASMGRPDSWLSTLMVPLTMVSTAPTTPRTAASTLR